MKSELEHGLKMMSKGKAVGVDNVSTEAIVALGEFGIEALIEIRYVTKLFSLNSRQFKNIIFYRSTDKAKSYRMFRPQNN